jgi:short-subunit dehydrogenase
MVVVVTGASAGIGAALCREVSRRGGLLVMSARRSDKLESLNRELGGQHLVIPADVAEPADCHRLLDRAFSWHGRIDVLVCNAGRGESRPVLDMTPERIWEMYRVNVLGTTECIRAAVPRMLQQPLRGGYRGQVMVVSSAAARRGLPLSGVYAATKASQLSISEALRVELSGQGIAVTTVHPIGTRTEFFDVAAERGGRTQSVRTPEHFMQTPELVARRMAHAMERPTREVWTSLGARVLLAATGLFPAIGDWIMLQARGHELGTADELR